jgi:hypothetical protein
MDWGIFKIVIDPIIKISSVFLGSLTLRFDRDASKTYWYTYDGDDNRNISPYLSRKRWSITAFSIHPVIRSSYDVKILEATVYAYHRALHRWIELEDHAGGVFPGPNVERSIRRLLATDPPFSGAEIGHDRSEAIQITKVGIFEHSLSAEYTLTLDDPSVYYVPVAVILNTNTKYLMFTCLIPEWTAARPVPAYFVGQPTIYNVNDREAMLERASGELGNAEQFGRIERTVLYRRIN